MTRRLALDWAICTGVLMLAYACRGWLLARMLEGYYPWASLAFDVVGLALVVAVFRTLDLILRVVFDRAIARWGSNQLPNGQNSAGTLTRGPARLRFAAGAARFCIVFGLAAPFLLTLAQLHPQRIGCSQTPGTLGMAYEDVSLASDGLQLSAWFIPSKQAAERPVVFIAHGIGANKQNFLNVAEQVHAWGYHVFMLDFRAHGESAGMLSTLGIKEAGDVKAACDWIGERCPRQPIYGVAYSMGGVGLVRACAQYGLCERIMLDSTFARLENSFRHTMQGVYVPSPLISLGWNACRFWGWTFTGTDPRELQCEDCVGQLACGSVLLIHGTKDRTTPYTDSVRLGERLNGKAEVWLIEGAGHLQTLSHPEYLGRMKRFLDRKDTTAAKTD